MDAYIILSSDSQAGLTAQMNESAKDGYRLAGFTAHLGQTGFVEHPADAQTLYLAVMVNAEQFGNLPG